MTGVISLRYTGMFPLPFPELEAEAQRGPVSGDWIPSWASRLHTPAGLGEGVADRQAGEVWQREAL